MPTTLNKKSYEKLIKEDIEWLNENTNDSIERRHIILVLNHSIEQYYGDK